MLLDLDKFYNSNYKDFVHKEALEQALKQVPEAFLKDIDAKAILSITFSVDDVGENPIYITYLDNNGKEHIVKLRPDITTQLTEVLKRYPTKGEMQEALDELHGNITSEYTTLVNSEVEALNTSINDINTSLTQQIIDATESAKEYTDNLKDELTPKITENKNRLYIKNHDGETKEVETSGRVTFEVNDGIKAIEVKQNDTEELPAERIDFTNLDAGPKVYVNPKDAPETMNNSIYSKQTNGTMDELVITDKDGKSSELLLSDYANKSELTTIREYNKGNKNVESLLIRTSGQFDVNQDYGDCLGFALNGRYRYASAISLSENDIRYIINQMRLNPKETKNEITYYPTDIVTSTKKDELALLESKTLTNLCTTSNTYSKAEVDQLLTTLCSGTPTVTELTPTIKTFGEVLELEENNTKILTFGTGDNAESILFINLTAKYESVLTSAATPFDLVVDWGYSMPISSPKYLVTCSINSTNNNYTYSETTSVPLADLTPRVSAPLVPASVTQEGFIRFNFTGCIKL